MGKFKDITGKEFGRLKAIKRVGQNENGHTLWLCVCKCGNKKTTTYYNLVSGSTKSCGCLRTENIIKASRVSSKNRTTHGGSHTKVYSVYNNMKARCYNPNNAAYYYYGAIGATVCDEWRNDFIAFRDWALANGYKEGLIFVRKDKDGPYSPDNCIFVPRNEVRKHGKETTAAT